MKQKHSQKYQPRYDLRQTFSLKKLSIGLVSVASGMLLFWGKAENVYASEEYNSDGETVVEPYIETTTTNDNLTAEYMENNNETISESELVSQIEATSNISDNKKTDSDTGVGKQEQELSITDDSQKNEKIVEANPATEIEDTSESPVENESEKSKETSQNMEEPVADYGTLPSESQLNYHKEELAAFIHYGMNTYTGVEWGNGKEDPKNFNPTNLDTDQWIKTLKDTGFKRTIMVTKHHDGFVIYPSKHTDHDIEASPYKNGQGDILEELSKSATKYDMDLGVYLSPWDANHPKYHVDTEDEYNEYYLNQLKEILGNDKYGNNGKFKQVWMDGARGDGAQKVTYTYDKWFKYIREQEGDITIFSEQPTNVRWIGNEKGIAGDPVWHRIDSNKLPTNDHNYLNTGDPEGDIYSVGEADVSIRPGWFYHEDQEPKTLQQLMDIYFKSVGRGTPLLLNIPPNREGRFADADVKRLYEFKETLDAMYAKNLAAEAIVEVDSTRQHELYAPDHLVDESDETLFAFSGDTTTGSITVDLGEEKTFDVFEIKEHIKQGQRIAKFSVDVEVDGKWERFGEGSTVGYRRLVQGWPTTARRIRLNIEESLATPVLAGIAVYKLPESVEKNDGIPRELTFISVEDATLSGKWTAEDEGVRGKRLWTKEAGAKVSYSFKGTKAYVYTTVDPGHGYMDVYIDGEYVTSVNTQYGSRYPSTLIYETSDLAYGEHVLDLVARDGTAIATEGIFALDNEGAGIFELDYTQYSVYKGNKLDVTVRRTGADNKKSSVVVATVPGTGVQGRRYEHKQETLIFEPGETEKTFTVQTIDFDTEVDTLFDFTIELSQPSDKAALGYYKAATVYVGAPNLFDSNEGTSEDSAPAESSSDYTETPNSNVSEESYAGEYTINITVDNQSIQLKKSFNSRKEAVNYVSSIMMNHEEKGYRNITDDSEKSEDYIFTLTFSSAEKGENEKIDMKNHQLQYGKPAENSYKGWEHEALPVGNGTLGSKVFGWVGRERIQFNEKTLWSGGPKPGDNSYNGGNLEGKHSVLPAIRQALEEGNTDEAKKLAEEHLVGPNSPEYGRYLSLGDIYLDFTNQSKALESVTNYKRTLDMDTATTSVRYKEDGTIFKRDTFISHPDKVMVTHLSKEGDKPLEFNAGLYLTKELVDGGSNHVNHYSEKESDYKEATVEYTEKGALLKGTVRDNGMEFASYMEIDTDGVIEVLDGYLRVTGATYATLMTHAVTNYAQNPETNYRDTTIDVAKVAQDTVRQAIDKTYEQVKEDHIKDHQDLFHRVQLDLGAKTSALFTDDLLATYDKQDGRALEELFYQYGRYLLITSSRSGKNALPANLQGVWNAVDNPAWNSDYHMNVNLQMNYWPAYSSNMAETALPLINFVDDLRYYGRVAAGEYANIISKEGEENGWLAHTQVTPFGWTTPGWNYYWGWSPAANAWIMQNVYEYFRFTQDKEFLQEKIYPTLKETAKFWNQFLHYDKDSDRWVSSPSYSPEHGTVTIGNTFDQSLVWQLFHDFKEATEVLRDVEGFIPDDTLLAEISEKFAKLKPLHINNDGRIKEWYEEDTDAFTREKVEKHHRHVSELVGLFPGTLFSKDNPKYMEAAKATLNRRGDGGTGWAKANKINLWARLLDGNRAHHLLSEQLRQSTLNNLWDTHPPFQIDGNFGATSGITEMLLQSHDGYIAPLPALSDVWKEGSVKGLKARGNVEVAMNWKNSTLYELQLTAHSGGLLTIDYPEIHNWTATINGETVAYEILQDNRIRIDSNEGDKIILKYISSEDLPGTPENEVDNKLTPNQPEESGTEDEQAPQPEIIKDYFKLIADFDGEQVVYDRKDSDVWLSVEQARKVYDQYLPEVVERDGKEYKRLEVTFTQSDKEAVLTYVYRTDDYEPTPEPEPEIYAGDYEFELVLDGESSIETLTFASRDKALDFVAVLNRLYKAAGYQLIHQDNGLPGEYKISLSFEKVAQPEVTPEPAPIPEPDAPETEENGQTSGENEDIPQPEQPTEPEETPEDQLETVEATFAFTNKDGLVHRGSLGEFSNLEQAERRIRQYANELGYTLQNFRLDKGTFLAEVDADFSQPLPEPEQPKEPLVRDVEARFEFNFADGFAHHGSLGHFVSLEQAERRIRHFANEQDYTLQNFRIEDGKFVADVKE
ncbi:glycosyl hydrolase family 95 catalytic domain-containing protein [Dolosigranulum savutiense]|uniref:alpha-L-fucosidase n=1 Tax=Dolosigranulum savutiense TaxID=3110288 RepID=A0AB74TSE5_9LACT